jgi:hypothetical protein
MNELPVHILALRGTLRWIHRVLPYTPMERTAAMRRRHVILVGAVLAALALGACSHTSGGSGGSAAGDVAFGAGGRNAVTPKPAAAPPAGSGTAASGGAYSIAKVPVEDGSAKIRTAEMTVAVRGWRNVAARADRAGSIAVEVGGEVDSDDRTSGRHASATLLLRIPPDALTATLTSLSKLGAEKSRQLSTTDVTEKVADVNSRIASARESIARLRTLYDTARKVADVISIESELNSREADLESLEAQQRILARQTTMAAITLSLVTARKAAAPPKKEQHRGGFVGGLQRGWDGFTTAASWIATALGTLLPFLALLLVLGIGARVLWPRLARRPAPLPAPSPSE